MAEQYLKKGSKVYIEGQLQTRKWTDQSGQERYSTEVVLQRFRGELTILDSRSDGGGRGGDAGGDYSEGGSDYGSSGPMEGRAPARSGGARGQSAGAPASNFSSDLDDDIPF